MDTKYKKAWLTNSRARKRLIIRNDKKKLILAELSRLKNKQWAINYFNERYSEMNIEYVNATYQKRLT